MARKRHGGGKPLFPGIESEPSTAHPGKRGRSRPPLGGALSPLGDVVLSPVGLVLDDDVPEDQWRRIGESLGQMERSKLWWVGDWIHFGNKRWGERYAEAETLTGYDYQTLANAASVSKSFETLSRRREKLSWSHHREVASLPPDQQDSWLDTAEAEGWSSRDLRHRITLSDPVKLDAALNTDEEEVAERQKEQWNGFRIVGEVRRAVKKLSWRTRKELLPVLIAQLRGRADELEKEGKIV